MCSSDLGINGQDGKDGQNGTDGKNGKDGTNGCLLYTSRCV